MIHVLLFLGLAFGGTWQPAESLRVPADTGLLIEQPGRARVLIDVTPADARIEATYEGLDIALQAGPGGTLLVPAHGTRRPVVLTASDDVSIRMWRESTWLQPIAWDRYERQLAAWARDGGDLPAAPAAIGGLAATWEARRAALESADELDSRFLTATMLYELEVVRARSVSDHGRELGDIVRVEPGGETALAVQGPGVLLLDARLGLPEGGFGAMEIGIERDGDWLGTRIRRAGEDPENPGLSWARRAEVFVPPGVHAFRITAGEEAFQVELAIERPRPSWRYADDLRDLEETAWPTGSVRAMEAAWVLADREDARDHAAEVLESAEPGSAAATLARSRLIATVDHPGEAVQLWLEDLTSPVVLFAIAERAAYRADIDATLVTPFAEALPDDPELLAALGDRVSGAFVRPRGEAIRWLAQLDARGSAASRWTELVLLEGTAEPRLVAQAPGVARVRLAEGEQAIVVLEDHPRGVPVVRLLAHEPVEYSVDELMLYGASELDEALEAVVEHRIAVQRGELLVLDPVAVVEGGLRVYEQQIAELPARWDLVEPGTPGQVAVTTYGGPGRVLAWTDDGRTWEMEVPAPLDPDVPSARFILPVAPFSNLVALESDDGIEASLALRRTSGSADRELPDPVGDPLEALNVASQILVGLLDEGGSGRAVADARLRRAGAFVALGYRGTARGEANLVLYLTGTTRRQREEARSPIAPGGFADAEGPATAAAALARDAQLPPLEPSTSADWLALLDQVSPTVRPYVYIEASRRRLLEGDVLGAWTLADSAGEAGIPTRRQAEYAGRFDVLTSLDRDGGVVHLRVERQPPDLDDGEYTMVREAALGMPWPGTEVAVVRGGREDRLAFAGGGALDLALLCRDEATRKNPPPCEVEVALNGVSEVVEIEDGHIATWSAVLPTDDHELLIRPLWDDHSAIVVRAELAGDLLPPVVTVPTHRLGRSGAGVTVLGPTLVKVRVHQGGPVTVAADGVTRVIEGVGVLPIAATGPVPVIVTGPGDALITMSRHDLAGLDAADLAVKPRAEAPEAPEPYGPSAWATWVWMNQVAHPARRTTAPMGLGGTFVFGGEVGDDVTTFPTALRHYPYAQGDIEWHQRVGLQRHWLHAQGIARLSIDGVPGGAFNGGWTWMPPNFAITADGAIWTSRSVGHGVLDAQVRYRRWVGMWWRVEPFVEGHWGVWTPPPTVKVDPKAWNTFGSQHPYGLGLGTHVDWRRRKDMRVRGTFRGYSNAGPSLDRISGRVGADVWVSDPLYVGVGTALEYRFQDEHRAFGFVRPSVDAYVTAPVWRAPSRRLMFDARARYYPQQNIADVRVRLVVELSQRRGLRDHAPIDEVYYVARELPEEQR
ncbi:MAG: hypothetical protein GY913_06890 [Proteobacteria bacterium]|nr:hypothetical protein [Pseudomonadota bacterium]